MRLLVRQRARTQLVFLIDALDRDPVQRVLLDLPVGDGPAKESPRRSEMPVPDGALLDAVSEQDVLPFHKFFWRGLREVRRTDVHP